MSMNADILPLRAPEALRRRLSALPEFDPPAWLDARVAAVLARAPQRRRWLLPVAVAAGALLAVGLAWRAPAPTTDADAGEAAWLARSRGLERELARLRPAHEVPGSALALEAELARVDRALQSAYDRGAAAPELQPLWQQRNDTLDSLLAAYRHRDGVVRI